MSSRLLAEVRSDLKREGVGSSGNGGCIPHVKIHCWILLKNNISIVLMKLGGARKLEERKWKPKHKIIIN